MGRKQQKNRKGASMDDVDDVSMGAEQIIMRCLALTPGQELLILADETATDVVTIIAEVAYRLEIAQTTILIPTVLQRHIPETSQFSLLTVGAAQEAHAILTCVNARSDCLPFRDHMLDSLRSARTRIGHMPGVNFDVLKLANVDFDQLIDDCQKLELMLARGHQLDLITHTPDGVQHILRADIGGWRQTPVASDGVIGDGMWGNVPSGETYIAPIEGSAEGSVVINGSFDNWIIDSEDYIVLHFSNGHVAAIEPADGEATRWLCETQTLPAQKRGDVNWSNLAEIGVGVNPAVTQLTGNMLFDEKAAATAHIALGSNTSMGGNVESVIHCDMVIKRPSIVIDGHLVFDHGKLNFDATIWRENYQQIMQERHLNPSSFITRSGVQVSTDQDRLQRVLRSESGRVSSCFIGDDATARLAAIIYDHVPESGDVIDIELLTRHLSLPPDVIHGVLQVLNMYELITLHTPDRRENDYE